MLCCSIAQKKTDVCDKTCKQQLPFYVLGSRDLTKMTISDAVHTMYKRNSHIDKKVVEDIIRQLNEKFGKESPFTPHEVN